MQPSGSAIQLTPDTRAGFARVQEQLREIQDRDPLAEAWIIMPPALYGTWRRQAEPALNVHLLSLTDAAVRLLRPVLPDLAVLSQTRRRQLTTRLMERVAAELRILPPPAQAPSLAGHVETLLRELKMEQVPPAEIRSDAERTGLPVRQDAALLYERYEALLREEDLWDEPRVLLRVLEQTASAAEDLAWPSFMAVCGQLRFSRLENALLAAARRRTDGLLVVLPAEAARCAKTLSVDLDLPMRNAKPCARKEPAYVTSLTPARESRFVLRQIKRRHLEEGIPLQDFTICVPNAHTYASLLESCADEYGLPLNLAMPLARHPMATVLLQVLRLAPDFAFHRTFDVLESPYVRQELLDAESLRDLRGIALDGNVSEGPDQWRRALQWAPEDDRKACIQAALESLFADCTPPADADASKILDWVAGFLSDSGDSNLRVSAPDDAVRQPFIPDAVARTALLGVLQRLRADLAASRLDWPGVLRLLAAELEREALPLFPKEAAVAVSVWRQAWFLPARHVYVLGLNEGVLPAAPRDGPLLDRRERDSLGLSPTFDPDLSLTQWKQLAANCEMSLTLCRPLADSEGISTAPSPYWTADEDAAVKDPGQATTNTAASMLELIAAQQAERVAAAPPEVAETLARSERMAGIARARLSWNGPVGPYEGHLEDPRIHADLQARFDERIWSASSLQEYPRCPLAFLAKRVLGLEPEPEAGTEMDFMVLGTALHETLERLFTRIRDGRLVLSGTSPDDLAAQVRNCVAEVWQELPHMARLQPYPLSAFDRRGVEALVFRAVELEREDGEWRPLHLEWKFGFQEPQEVRWRDPDEGTELVLPLRGMVDRVDRSEDGRLRVVDYKSRKRRYSGGEIEAGYSTQAVLYALIVQSQGWGPVVESGFRMLRDTAKAKLQNALDWSGDEPPDALTILRTLSRHQTDMRRGRFPAAPAIWDERYGNEMQAFCQVTMESRIKARAFFET